MNSASPLRPEEAILRVFCVDDHAIFLEGLRAFFGILAQRGERIAFAGSAQSSSKALADIELLRPDIVLLDVWLSRRPGFTGLDLLRDLRARGNDIPVIAYSGILLNEPQLEEFLELDLDGYLLKDGNPQSVLQAILQVMEGKPFFSPEIEPLFNRIRAKRKSQAESNAFLPIHLLSQQERAVLVQILKGVPRKEIAETMNLTRSSIDTYRRRILLKLDIPDFAELDVPLMLVHLAQNDRAGL